MRNTAQKALSTVRGRIQDTPARRRGTRGSRLMAEPSGTAAAHSSDDAMRRWLGLAVGYHSARYLDQIVAFKTVAGPGGVDGLPALYVWEVAHCREPDGMRWAFIVWDVSGGGVRFRDCADRDEAMALYALPTERGIAAVQGCPGVYLRRSAQTA